MLVRTNDNIGRSALKVKSETTRVFACQWDVVDIVLADETNVLASTDRSSDWLGQQFKTIARDFQSSEGASVGKKTGLFPRGLRHLALVGGISRSSIANETEPEGSHAVRLCIVSLHVIRHS